MLESSVLNTDSVFVSHEVSYIRNISINEPSFQRDVVKFEETELYITTTPQSANFLYMGETGILEFGDKLEFGS